MVQPPAAPRIRLTRTVDFAASLRFARPELSEAENRRLYGPAASTHGHNYRVAVTVEGKADPRTGMLLDLKELKEVLEREIVARFDHRDLNRDTPFFEKQPPTPENLAAVIYRLLADVFPSGTLHGVRLWQDEDVWVDVTGEEDAT